VLAILNSPTLHCLLPRNAGRHHPFNPQHPPLKNFNGLPSNIPAQLPNEAAFISFCRDPGGFCSSVRRASSHCFGCSPASPTLRSTSRSRRRMASCPQGRRPRGLCGHFLGDKRYRVVAYDRQAVLGSWVFGREGPSRPRPSAAPRCSVSIRGRCKQSRRELPQYQAEARAIRMR
jgi:hypothetical protein